jgi:amino acid transporter
LGRQALPSFVNAGSFCICVAFLGVSLSVMRLRRSHPQLLRTFRLPGGRWIPATAALASVALLGVMLWPGSPAALAWPREVLILAVLAVLGAWLWFGGAGARAQIEESRRAFLILEHHADAAVAPSAGATE